MTTITPEEAIDFINGNMPPGPTIQHYLPRAIQLSATCSFGWERENSPENAAFWKGAWTAFCEIEKRLKEETNDIRQIGGPEKKG